VAHGGELPIRLGWNPDQFRICDRVEDRAPDPPHRVCRELSFAAVIELLNGANQSDCSLLHEVGERNAAVGVGLRHSHHQPQIALDHSFLGLQIAAFDALGKRDLLSRRQQVLAHATTASARVDGCHSACVTAKLVKAASAGDGSSSRDKSSNDSDR
jgi:hypothetical protein